MIVTVANGFADLLDVQIGRLEQSASPIRNIKQYLKTTLFNATGTMNSYYDALVRHEQRRKYDWMDDLDG